jgi:hypothetical protein
VETQPKNSILPGWKILLFAWTFVLTIWMPSLFIPGFLNYPKHGLMPYWIFLSAGGAVLCSQLIFANVDIWKRILLGLLAFVGGCCCYLGAFYWASGSTHTSPLEIILASPLGVLLIVYILKCWQKWKNPTASKIAAEKSKSIWTRVHRRKFHPIIFVIFFVGFSVLTARNLSILAEAQKFPVNAKSATLSFYDRFGYWPAAFLTPCVGLVFICYCAWLNYKNRKTNL